MGRDQTGTGDSHMGRASLDRQGHQRVGHAQGGTHCSIGASAPIPARCVPAYHSFSGANGHKGTKRLTSLEKRTTETNLSIGSNGLPSTSTGEPKAYVCLAQWAQAMQVSRRERLLNTGSQPTSLPCYHPHPTTSPPGTTRVEKNQSTLYIDITIQYVLAEKSEKN
jgi:hypothetical protein